MTYLPPPKGTFDVEWATQNNRIIQQEIGKLGPLASRVSELETGKQPSDADLTAIAALTGTGMLERTGSDKWALRSTGAVGRSLLALAAPGAVRHIRVNADGSVDLRAAADYRGDLALGTIATQNANNVTITGGTAALDSVATTGNATFGGTVRANVGGVYLGSASSARLSPETGDGADTGQVLVSGGGTAGVARGAYLRASGNEHATLPGIMELYAGNVAGAEIRLGNSTVVSGNTSITGTISASNLSGTTYTPTGTGVTNVTSVTPSLAIYDRLIGAASVNGKVSIVTTAAGPTTARLSLPVSSNIGTTTDVSGIAIATDGTVATISGDATNDAAVITFTASAGTLFQFEAAFKYRIL